MAGASRPRRETSELSRCLLAWFQKSKRDLPWRGARDPYATWVSEIMLQQTRVDTVIPYYARWMEQFPNIRSLARASEHEVLQAWEGLGYYSRARNMRRAAQLLVNEHHGQLPDDPDTLQSLPGIGRYTAGAIASIAFGRDEAALDANIRRVLARVFDVAEPADSPAGVQRLWELARSHLPAGQAGDYNEALMDLGATICLPSNPHCEACPLRKICRARDLGVQDERPVLKPKISGPHYTAAAAVIVQRRRVLMVQRPSSGLLGGMWEFPNARVSRLTPAKVAAALREAYGLSIKCGEETGSVRHAYSHFSVDVHIFNCAVISKPKGTELRWVPLRDLDDYPMGKVDRSIARKLA